MSKPRPVAESSEALSSGSQQAAIASSARLIGTAALGEHSALAQGAVLRSHDEAVRVGAATAVLENSVVLGRADLDVSIGRRTVFGHRCLVIGATIGDLCEIGNGTIILPGARLGDRVFTGEGALIPAGTMVPDGAVVVGRPGRAIRTATDDDMERLAGLRGGDLSLPADVVHQHHGRPEVGATMGQLYVYRDREPAVDPTATLFDSAEVTGDVTIGAGSIIGAGVRIIGDSHGPVRIGARVQILENTVLHLLPDNELILDDDVIIGPGAMIHGCRIGAGSVVEPGAIVCDWSLLGANTLVRAGAVVKQRSVFADGAVLDGFPAKEVDTLTEAQPVPAWAFLPGDLESLRRI